MYRVMSWTCCVTVALVTCAILAAPVDKPPPLTTFEQNIATRCELLFGENARPHVMLHGHMGSIDEWLPTPANLRRVVDASFGVHILFKNRGDYVNGDAQVGIPPVDGRLKWVDPERMKRAVQFLHDLDPSRVALFYLHPGAFHSTGMTGGETVDEIVRQCREYGWDGVYLDGLTLGNNIQETLAALRRLRDEGVYVAAHATVHPHITRNGWIYGPGDIAGGKVDWFAEGILDYVDLMVWGEGREVSDDPAGMALLKRMSSVATAPGWLFLWEPGAKSPWTADVARRMPMTVDLLMTEWTTPTNLATFEEHRLPAYEAARAEYQENPGAFVRRAAREW